MGDIIGSIIGLTVIYTVLLVIEVFLMVKYIRIGPSSLHTGRYHFEDHSASAA
jgi:cytochrome d ubiquinol oxidase subunit I